MLLRMLLLLLLCRAGRIAHGGRVAMRLGTRRICVGWSRLPHWCAGCADPGQGGNQQSAEHDAEEPVGHIEVI